MTVIFGQQCRINLFMPYFLGVTKVLNKNDRMKTNKFEGLRMKHSLDIRVVSFRNHLLYIDKYTSFGSNCKSLCTWYFVSLWGQTIITTTTRIRVSQIGNFAKFKVYLKCDETFFQYGSDITYILIPEQKPLVYGNFYREENEDELILVAGTRVFCREIANFPYTKVYREIYVNGKISKSPFYIPPLNTETGRIMKQNQVVLGCRFTYLLAMQYDANVKVFLKISQTFPAFQRCTVMSYLFRGLFFMVQFMSQKKDTISGFNIMSKKDILICRAEIFDTATLAITIPLCYGTRVTKNKGKRGPISVSISTIYLKHKCGIRQLTATCTLFLPKQRYLHPYKIKLLEYFVIKTNDKKELHKDPIIQILCTTGHIAMPDSVIDIQLLDRYKQFLRQLTINVQSFGKMHLINEPFIIPWKANYLTDKILRVTGTLYMPRTNRSRENNKRKKVFINREFNLFIPINSLEVSRNGSIKHNEVVFCSGQGMPQPSFHWKQEQLPRIFADDEGRASLAIDYKSNSFRFTKLAESGIYLMTCIGENNLQRQLIMRLEETFMFRLEEGRILWIDFNLGYSTKLMYLISGCIIVFLVLVVHFHWNKEFYKTIFYNLGQTVVKAFYSQVKAFIDDLKQHAKGKHYNISETMFSKSDWESSHYYGSRFLNTYDVNSFSYDYDFQKASLTEADIDEQTLLSSASDLEDSDMNPLLNDSKRNSHDEH